MNNENNNYRTGEVTQLRRIADSLEEILRLVKKDMEDNKKRWEEKDIEERYDQITKEMKEEDKKRLAEKDE